MNRDNAELVAQIVDRICRLEKSIFELQQLVTKDTFVITGKIEGIMGSEITVKLLTDEISTVVFSQDILELFINTLNLELNELVKSLENF